MEKDTLRLIHICKRQDDPDFDFGPVARLMRKILELNYTYWLSEEDPLPWYEKQCGDYCVDANTGQLLAAISHDRIRANLADLKAIELRRIPALLWSG